MSLIIASSFSICFKSIISWLANDLIYRAVFLFLSLAREEELYLKAERSCSRGSIKGLLIGGVSTTIGGLSCIMALSSIANYT